MPIPSNPPVLPMVIAANGDTHDIPDTTPAGTGQMSYQAGFPPITSLPLLAGGIAPDRLDFNAFMKLATEHLFFQQSGGVYAWVGASADFPGLNYLVGARVMGTDGIEYKAVKASGPDIPGDVGFVGPKDPVEDSDGFWLNSSKNPVQYELGEFYYFRHPVLRPGFETADGGRINNAAELYPDIWAYLQTTDGQLLCKTEAEWQAMNTAIWHTNADGSTVGWDGIGGAPFYVQDLGAGTLRMPDIRGMYIEAAGFDSLDVGGVHGDASRRVQAVWTALGSSSGANAVTGAAGYSNSGVPAGAGVSGSNKMTLTFDSDLATPTGNKNAPRAWGALACVYLGTPR